MSDEIREQEWKTIWDAQEFQPPKKGWEAMERALAGKSEAPAATALPWWGWRRYGRVAAAAAVLCLGTWSIWQFSRQPEAMAPEQHMAAREASMPQPSPVQETIPDQNEAAPAIMPAAVHKPYQPIVADAGTQETIVNTIVYTRPEVPALKDPADIITVQPVTKTEEPIARAPERAIASAQESSAGNTQQQENPSGFEPITNQTVRFDEHQLDRSMSVGLAANIGKPNLGNVQYNVGVVLRKEWTDAFYTEAAVSMAATDVRFSENARYGISYKSGEFVSSEGSNAAAANTIGETQNVYGNNILGVGLAPMMGYKVTPQISVAVGVDLYRNINTGLNLYYNSDIAEKNIKAMSMVKNVSQWDSGVKGQLGIRVNKALSVLGQYRQGLTNYISTDQKGYKSSLFNIGLMYRFQP